MARIRTIKPEFPQSESMGRVSRESRYCFILLWTLADDSGRLRGNSRMLASLLYPYDLDAGKLIDKWLGELEHEKCLVRYAVEDDTYIQISNWLKHQKIDKPSASKIPAFTEDSRILSNPRERSCEDQGSRKGSKDQGKDQGKDLTCIASDTMQEPNLFLEVRQRYPKRGGSQKWGDAEKAYNARLREGHTHEEICWGIDRYTKFLTITGKLGSEYVQMASTFLGPNKGFLELWQTPEEPKGMRQLSAVERVELAISKSRGERNERVVSEQTGSGFGSLEELMRDVR